MTERVSPSRPGGFLDFLTPEYLAREKMLKIIERVFRSYGFDPIETPMVEFEEVLAGETSDTGKQIFKVVSKSERGNSDEKSLALRFDQTVPFARLLAANPYDASKRSGIRLPWRRMVVGPVFRGERPQSGRYRQFYQFDADIAGTASMVADAEIIAMIYATLSALGLDRFMIKLNNRKILNGLAALCSIKERPQVKQCDIIKEMMRILDKIDKVGLDKTLCELQRLPEDDFDPAPGLSSDSLGRIKSFLEIKGDNSQKLQFCHEIFGGVETACEGIEELRLIFGYLRAMGIPEQAVEVDFSIARGLDYYTGPVMETILLDAPQFGSIFSGGRYNDLVSRFTGQELPAVGASVGVDRLFSALKRLGRIDLARQTDTDVMVLKLIPEIDAEYLKIAAEIRSAGKKVEVCLFEDISFKAQFNFAVNRGVKYIVIYGENEFAKRVVQIKNLDTREQTEISMNGISEYFENLK